MADVTYEVTRIAKIYSVANSDIGILFQTQRYIFFTKRNSAV